MTPTFLGALIASIVTFLVYLPAVIPLQWLTYRDPFFVTQNPMVIEGQSIWLTCINQHVWMPFTFLMYRLIYLLAGLNAGVFHVFNVLVFVVGNVFFGLAISRVIKNRTVVWAAVLGYALLPIHAPLVASVSESAELIAQCLLGLLIFAGLKYASKKRWRWLCTAIVSGMLLLFVKPPVALLSNSVLVGILLLCVLVAKLMQRFDVFLQTQEKVIRYLFGFFVAGVFVISGLVTYERVTWFKDDVTLWSHVSRMSPSVSAYLRLAMSLQDNLPRYPSPEHIDQINDCYIKAKALNKKDALVYLQFADFLIRLHQTVKAKEILKELFIYYPHHPQGLISLAGIALLEHDAAQVVGLINELTTVYPDDEKILLSAIAVYNKASILYPQDKIFHEKREELLMDMTELSKRKKYKAGDFYNLALLYQQVGGKDEAIRYYQKALQLNPTHELALFNLAKMNQVQGDVKIALALYDKLIRAYPKSPQAYLNMALIYIAQNDIANAKRMLLKTIAYDPNNSDAYFNLGYIGESEKDLKIAADSYEKAVELNPANAEAYYNLGNVYASQGLSAEAIAAYLKTTEINPKHMNAYVNLAIMSFKSRDIKGAINYLGKAQALGYVAPEAFLKTLEPYRK